LQGHYHEHKVYYNAKHVSPNAHPTGALQSVANFAFCASDEPAKDWDCSQAPPYPAGAKHIDPTADHPQEQIALGVLEEIKQKRHNIFSTVWACCGPVSAAQAILSINLLGHSRQVRARNYLAPHKQTTKHMREHIHLQPNFLHTSDTAGFTSDPATMRQLCFHRVYCSNMKNKF
jgi:hypothetical protein